MKITNQFCMMLSLLLGLFVFTACDDDDEAPQPELTLPVQSVEVQAEGGSYALSYGLLNPVKGESVKASANVGWISVDTVTASEVKFVVEKNSDYEQREAVIAINYVGVPSALECKVIQAASLRPVLSLAGDSVKVVREGAQNLEMKYSVEHALDGVLPKMKCEASWISEMKVAEGVLSFNVAPNEGPEARETEIQVSYEGALDTLAFVVSQAEGNPNLTFTVGDQTFKMIYVKAGTFTMGAGAKEAGANSWEKPAHEVTLTEDYYIGELEVTQGLWMALMDANPSQYQDVDSDMSLPVEKVNYFDVQEFIEKLNAKTGRTFVLPTEAQWEYAARGGQQSKGYKYSGSNELDEVAWYDGNAGFKTHPAGSKLPNELGIYDMCGNVMEWCSDWYGNYSSASQVDPKGAPSNSDNYRVSRGGGFFSLAGDMRVVFRAGSEAKSHMFFQGFRLAMIK